MLISSSPHDNYSCFQATSYPADSYHGHPGEGYQGHPGGSYHGYTGESYHDNKMEVVMNLHLDYDYTKPEVTKYIDGFLITPLEERVTGYRVRSSSTFISRAY